MAKKLIELNKYAVSFLFSMVQYSRIICMSPDNCTNREFINNLVRL